MDTIFDEPIEEVNSNIEFQKILYFHMIYNCIVIFEIIFSTIFKYFFFYDSFTTITTPIFIFFFICLILIEFFKFYFGYIGNLEENIAKLFPAIIIIVLKFFLNIYFMIFQPPFSLNNFFSELVNNNLFNLTVLKFPLKIDVIVFFIDTFFLIIEFILLIFTISHFLYLSSKKFPIFFNKDGTIKIEKETEKEILIKEQRNQIELEEFIKKIKK